MIVGNKRGKFLEFTLDDGSVVKYDLSTGECIGKSGRPVQRLNHCFSGMDLKDIIESIDNASYRDFLWWVYDRSSSRASNLGTLLQYAAKPWYRDREQYFSLGIKHITKNSPAFRENPSGLIKIYMRHTDICPSRELAEIYKTAPDLVNTAFSMLYVTLTYKELSEIFAFHRWEFKIEELVLNEGFSASALCRYFDYLMTHEALSCISMIQHYIDYLNMARKLSKTFDKYPKNLLTTHHIMTRNYNRLKAEIDEKRFQEKVDPRYEYKRGKYMIKVPTSSQDIKDEAVQQHNCVASYIDRVIAGTCNIVFMRKVDDPDHSYVTVEVRNGKAVQYLRAYNQPVSSDDREFLTYYEKYLKENEL